MDIEKIKKYRPVIAVALIILIILFFCVPLFFKDDSKIKASGTVEVKQVDISSRLSSYIEKINVNEGTFVKKGDILAVLNDPVIHAQKEAATVAYKNAKKNFERNEILFKSGSISAQQYEVSLAAYTQAFATYQLYNETEVKAPWDGIILEKHVEEGELVSPGTPLFTLGDLSEAKITIYLPLKEMSLIKHGMKADVIIDAFKDKKFDGVISYIADEAEFTPKNIQTKDERVKQVFAVQVTVPNPEFILKPGIPADVIIDLKINR